MFWDLPVLEPRGSRLDVEGGLVRRSLGAVAEEGRKTRKGRVSGKVPASLVTGG